MSAPVRIGDALVATIDLDRGAKITSLRDRDGHEWLLPPAPMARPPVGTPFVEAEMGGWDECAPTIDAATLPDGRALPDHGDLWDVQWRGTAEQHRVRGRSLPFELTRSVRAVPSGLRLDYTVVADTDLPFVWAAHPQFRAPAGTRVVLDGVERVVDVLDTPPSVHAWPDGVNGIDTDPRETRKVYADPGRPVGRAALVVPGRAHALVLRWDAHVAPYVGVWFDRAALAREPVLAIEPTTGFYDSPVRALANDRVLRLTAGTRVDWFVELTLER